MRLSASILMNFFPGLNVFETKFSRQKKKKKSNYFALMTIGNLAES